jgi:hypothetical protein
MNKTITREEMIAFLRENLSIAVDGNSIYQVGYNEVRVTVNLLLGKEVISDDTCTITVWHE